MPLLTCSKPSAPTVAGVGASSRPPWYCGALVPSTFANLSIEPSDVGLSVDPPEVGESVDIEVTVRNRTRVAAGPFDIQLFDGDPETGGLALGPPQAFAGLAASGTGLASFTWDTSGLEGSHALYAIADFAGAVAEVSKEDNVAIRNVEVLPPLPNLVVSLFALEPTSPVSGTSATLHARVENHGSAAASATTARGLPRGTAPRNRSRRGFGTRIGPWRLGGDHPRLEQCRPPRLAQASRRRRPGERGARAARVRQ